MPLAHSTEAAGGASHNLHELPGDSTQDSRLPSSCRSRRLGISGALLAKKTMSPPRGSSGGLQVPEKCTPSPFLPDRARSSQTNTGTTLGAYSFSPISD